MQFMQNYYFFLIHQASECNQWPIANLVLLNLFIFFSFLVFKVTPFPLKHNQYSKESADFF